MKVTMRRSHQNVIDFALLFAPIFFLVHSSKSIFNFDQLRRSTSTDYIPESVRLQLTLTGTRNVLPTRRESIFLEHVLFGYLNKALTPLSFQVQLVEIDKSRTRVEDGHDASSFTVISHTAATVRKDESIDHQEYNMGKSNVAHERELQVPGKMCTVTNKLFVEVEISGRDYTMRRGTFKEQVFQAIRQGNIRRRELIELLVAPVEAEKYFSDLCSVQAIIQPEISRYRPDRWDPADLIGVNKEENNSTTHNSDATLLTERRPMNAKAVQFRTISGSIFISLCITAVLSNVIRILGRQRENRKQRMEKAKQAYEVPKQAELRRKSGEKFVGMLDNGAVPTR